MTVLERRPPDSQQRAMPETYLAEVETPLGAHVLAVGCETGPLHFRWVPAECRASPRVTEKAELTEVVSLESRPIG